jgi:hypothetical protein
MLNEIENPVWLKDTYWTPTERNEGRKMNKILFGLLFTAVTASTALAATKSSFIDVTKDSDVNFLHKGPQVDERLRNLGPWFTALGAGGSAGDINNDGLLDLYFTNNLTGTKNSLYLNKGQMKFEDIAISAGVADLNDEANFSTMSLLVDLDNDGWKDLFLTRFGSSKIFKNLKNGKFEDVTERSEIPSPRNPVTAVAIDFDRDGDLDIYVGCYFPDVDLTNLGKAKTSILHESWETARNGGTNYFLENQGDFKFVDVTEKVKLGDVGWTLALGTGDIDKDGWIDIYMANDFGADKIYRNTGKGYFTDVSESSIGIDTKKGMNVEMGDYDNDGWLDIYVTNITEPYLYECNMLWRNNGDFTFMDVSKVLGVCDTQWGWGAKFIDFNNDGFLDIYVLNGFITGNQKDYIDVLMPIMLEYNIDLSDTMNWPAIGGMSFSGNEKNRLFKNNWGMNFIEVGAKHSVDSNQDGRGLIVADLNNDGYQDMVVMSANQPVIIYKNTAINGNNWIDIELTGTKSNRDGIGTKVTFYSVKGIQYRETNAGNGFESQSTILVHAGLGKLKKVSKIEVVWPSGTKQVFRDVEVNKHYKLVEGGELKQ